MPLYEYQCDACGERFEVIRKFSDEPIDTCRKCGKGPVHRLQSSPAIQFKGSGFYINDYAQKGKSSESSSSGGKDSKDSSDGAKDTKSDKSESSSTSSSSGDSAKTESKSEAAPAAKPDSKPAAKP
jgi:putative FmdB family regulatory protein